MKRLRYPGPHRQVAVAGQTVDRNAAADFDDDTAERLAAAGWHPVGKSGGKKTGRVPDGSDDADQTSTDEAGEE